MHEAATDDVRGLQLRFIDQGGASMDMVVVVTYCSKRDSDIVYTYVHP